MQYETEMARVTHGYDAAAVVPSHIGIGPDTGLDLKNVSAMILEQTELMRKTLSGVLKSMGLRDVWSTDNPRQAFEGLTRQPADLVFCDWSPKLNGISFLNAVRRHPETPSPYTPVIMVSAYTEPDRIFTARDNGMTEYIAKPFTAMRVYTRIWEVVMRHRQFIRNNTFFGPDRRRRRAPITGTERRASHGDMVLSGV